MSDIDKLYFDGNGFESDYDYEPTHNRFGLKNIFDDVITWDDMYDNLWDEELWDNYY
ncbi:MAG: hypothetical protein KKI12_10190 [Proteobacteria bacterium]|nr:hypothetical protein [Pseudomonadota bacterium]MBU4260225.1 hypothetical protein [Pseudomonadota bacterium]MBU4288525.1 hypothetical protein [Pseudomonadota bacterium]MBU4415209.1 hypothetical protein [Pseudomonadota bacterium]MCG2759011.1 hypothetical protein [Desulfobacteraceae bacterium]